MINCGFFRDRTEKEGAVYSLANWLDGCIEGLLEGMIINAFIIGIPLVIWLIMKKK